MRTKVAWLANTRPDLQFETFPPAQVTLDSFNQDAEANLKRLNTIVRYAHNNAAHPQFSKLKLSNLRVVGYSDAASANNHDLTSQLGRILILLDDNNRCAHISFKS